MQTARIKKEEEEEDCIEIPESRLVNVSDGGTGIILDGKWIQRSIFARTRGEFDGKSVYLPDGFDYVLAKDNLGFTILIPLEKESK